MEEVRDAFTAFAAAQSLVQQRFQSRLQRTYEVLHSFNPSLAAEVFNHPPPPRPSISREVQAATFIQRMFRGFQARRLYCDLLYEKYAEEEEREREVELRRMEEGMLLLESIQLQEELTNKKFLSKQRDLERHSAATMIQRAFRRHKRLPLPMSAVRVIPDEMPLAGFWSESIFDVSAAAETSKSDSDSDDEVFKKQHRLSLDSNFEDEVPIPGITSLGKLDLDGATNNEMDRTSVSVKPIPVMLDMSLDVAMRSSEPQARPSLESPTKISRIEGNRIKAELRLESVHALRKKFSALTTEATHLSEDLILCLEQRETLRENIEFSKRVLNYLSTL